MNYSEYLEQAILDEEYYIRKLREEEIYYIELQEEQRRLEKLANDLEIAPMLPFESLEPLPYDPPSDWVADNTKYPIVATPVPDSDWDVPY